LGADYEQNLPDMAFDTEFNSSYMISSTRKDIEKMNYHIKP